MTDQSQPGGDKPQGLNPYVQAETNFLRYPIASLNKHFKGNRLEYRHTFYQAGKEVVSTWVVSGAEEMGGVAGELGAKLDLAITKLIFDARKRHNGELPRCIKTSLYELAVLMQLKPDRKARHAIRAELLKLAATRIIAKQSFAVKTNGKRTYPDIEMVISKYSVILRGSTLPDGTVADGVYIALGEYFYQNLKENYTKAINFNYAMSLPPAASRIYELLALQFVKPNNTQYVDLNYEDFCDRVPIKKWPERFRAREKMKEFLAQLDGYLRTYELHFDGKPADWFIRFFPGPAAFQELIDLDSQREFWRHIPPTKRPALPTGVAANGAEVAEREAKEHAYMMQRIRAFPLEQQLALEARARESLKKRGDSDKYQLTVDFEMVELFVSDLLGFVE